MTGQHNSNRSKAIAAAKSMHSSYGIGANPVGRPKRSNHNSGLAVDMTITNFAGKKVSIDGTSYRVNSFNDLVKIGEVMSVHWYGSNDKPHWSHNGR